MAGRRPWRCGGQLDPIAKLLSVENARDLNLQSKGIQTEPCPSQGQNRKKWTVPTLPGGKLREISEQSAGPERAEDQRNATSESKPARFAYFS